VTKARRRDFELQSSELWGNKNDLSAQLQIQLIGVETKIVPFLLLKISTIHKKYVFRTFWGLSGGGRSRFYKKLCTRVLLQNAVRDKSPPETRTSRIESVLCGWKELWTLIFWTWVKLDYETKRAGTSEWHNEGCLACGLRLPPIDFSSSSPILREGVFLILHIYFDFEVFSLRAVDPRRDELVLDAIQILMLSCVLHTPGCIPQLLVLRPALKPNRGRT